MPNQIPHTRRYLQTIVVCSAMLAPGGVALAATLTTLHTFTGPEVSGTGNSPTGVVADAAGNLYGTTYKGGLSIFNGVLFKLASDGTETVLKEFTSQGDPSTLLLDSSGVLHGTISGIHNIGVVFKQAIGGAYRPVAPFKAADSGTGPFGGVIADDEGNIYGTTLSGGIGRSTSPDTGYGTIYKLSPTGQLTTIYAFTGGLDGYYPHGGVVEDSTGHFFGTASYGGTAHLGEVFKLEPSGRLKVLYSFAGGMDGSGPSEPIMRDSAGNLFGTTSGGGVGGGGIVFKLSPAGKETVLYAFGTGTDGKSPSSALVADQEGNLYGTTFYGGAHDQGMVFELSPTGVETILHEFTGKGDGSNPTGRLVLATDGTVIGATQNGGTDGIGTIFKITP